MPTADCLIEAVHQVIVPDSNAPGGLSGPFKWTKQEQTATLHFASNDDTHGVGTKAEMEARAAARAKGVGSALMQLADAQQSARTAVVVLQLGADAKPRCISNVSAGLTKALRHCRR